MAGLVTTKPHWEPTENWFSEILLHSLARGDASGCVYHHLTLLGKRGQWCLGPSMPVIRLAFRDVIIYAF